MIEDEIQCDALYLISLSCHEQRVTVMRPHIIIGCFACIESLDEFQRAKK